MPNAPIEPRRPRTEPRSACGVSLASARTGCYVPSSESNRGSQKTDCNNKAIPWNAKPESVRKENVDCRDNEQSKVQGRRGFQETVVLQCQSNVETAEQN